MGKAENEAITKDGRISFTTGLKAASRYLADPDPAERNESAKLLVTLLKYYESGKNPIQAYKLCGAELLEAFNRNLPDQMPDVGRALRQLCRSLWIYHAYDELAEPLQRIVDSEHSTTPAVAWLYETKLVLASREEAEVVFAHLQRLWKPSRRMELAANFFEKGDLSDWRVYALSRAGAFFLERSTGADICKFRKLRKGAVPPDEQVVLLSKAETLIAEALSLVERRIEQDMRSQELPAGERGFQSLPYFYTGRLAELRGDQARAYQYYQSARTIAKKLHLSWRLDDYDSYVDRLAG